MSHRRSPVALVIIVVKPSAEENFQAQILERLARLGLNASPLASGRTSLIVVQDDVSNVPGQVFSSLPGVEKIIKVQPQAPLSQDGRITSFNVGEVTVGRGSEPVIAAGPCSVEGQAQVVHLAHKVKDAGATMLRGGAFKPRTSPYDFQGLGKEALVYLAEARAASGLPIVSEVMSAAQVALAEPYVDMFQIGTRNMYNYELLREVGRSQKPVLLKRAMSATIQEFVNAAEYILLEGNFRVVLCERGIRSFDTATRNTLDLSAVPVLQSMTQFPVFVDPSHGTGRSDLISPMCRAAIACGADGLLIEVHDEPTKAFSDGKQAVTPDQLGKITADCLGIYRLLSQQTEQQMSVRAK